MDWSIASPAGLSWLPMWTFIFSLITTHSNSQLSQLEWKELKDLLKLYFSLQKDWMCYVLKSEQFFVFLSEIFKTGETADGRYCFTGNKGKEPLKAGWDHRNWLFLSNDKVNMMNKMPEEKRHFARELSIVSVSILALRKVNFLHITGINWTRTWPPSGEAS